MSNARKSSKKIVSKGQYVAAQGQKAGIGLSGVFLLILTAFFGLWTLALLVGSVATLNLLGVLITACFGGITYWLSKGTRNVLNAALKVDPGIPLTRANTGDLPEPDSLVRASQEPPQAQKDILLRAASGQPETHQDQLLRASAEAQEENR